MWGVCDDWWVGDFGILCVDGSVCVGGGCGGVCVGVWVLLIECEWDFYVVCGRLIEIVDWNDFWYIDDEMMVYLVDVNVLELLCSK